ncbi:diaminopimelate decarboxylase [Pelagibacteraceae bacterium]|jgi:diaminopimelate decarboxylase|nr:diaminopimelate decarboxylase [Pelagibacteraceae bacterium]|tara:strand:- start:1798 stop:3027 length:1230 start_codon:yes stop_codon:yes gene_type:complete
MSYFKYVGQKLFVEKVSIFNIIKKNKTPFYLYSETQLRDNYLSFEETFKKVKPLICFAAKANTNLTILKMLGRLGSGADVVSGGELLKVIKAGIKPNKIVFSGVGKNEDELILAIKKNILLINVESESEAKLINKLAKKFNRKVSIGIRINPNVDAKTHKNISTGKAENKFGLSIKNFINFYRNIDKFRNLKIDAISVHIGSQILSDVPYKKTLGIIKKIITNLNIKLKYIDLGGGFGISYKKEEKKINLKEYSKLVYDFKKKLNCNIIFEPGRSLVGNAGILVTKIQYVKTGLNKNFIILDAGMNDFMRPALYGATHDIIPLFINNKKSNGIIEFVGPICETTCKFIKYKKYQKVSENDFMAITDVGAYGSSLSSNYNTKPLIAEILVKKNKFKIIKKKQDLFKLISS